MKKLFTILCIVMSISIAKAQYTTDQQATPAYRYCQLIMQPRPFSAKVNITVDYGQETKFFQDTRLRDEQSGKLVKFNSIIDALNYMAEQGWEYLDSYTTNTANNATTLTSTTSWVMRQKIK